MARTFKMWRQFVSCLAIVKVVVYRIVDFSREAFYMNIDRIWKICFSLPDACGRLKFFLEDFIQFNGQVVLRD